MKLVGYFDEAYHVLNSLSVHSPLLEFYGRLLGICWYRIYPEKGNIQFTEMLHGELAPDSI